MPLPYTLTIESLLKYWEVSMIVVTVVVSLSFATTEIIKKQFKIKGQAVLYWSLGLTLVWTLAMIVSIPEVTIKGIIATWIVSFITASGGWAAFKQILTKTGQKLNLGKK